MSADGTWNITMDTPMGSQPATLTLDTSGGGVTGNLASSQGTIGINEGTVEGDVVNFKAEMSDPMPMTLEFSAKVDGDNISGSVGLGSFGSASFSGTRA